MHIKQRKKHTKHQTNRNTKKHVTQNTESTSNITGLQQKSPCKRVSRKRQWHKNPRSTHGWVALACSPSSQNRNQQIHQSPPQKNTTKHGTKTNLRHTENSKNTSSTQQHNTTQQSTRLKTIQITLQTHTTLIKTQHNKTQHNTKQPNNE